MAKAWLDVDRSALEGKGEPLARFAGDRKADDPYREGYESGLRSAQWEVGYNKGRQAGTKGKAAASTEPAGLSPVPLWGTRAD